MIIATPSHAQNSDDEFWERFDHMMQEEDKEFDAFFDQFEKWLSKDSQNLFQEMKQKQEEMFKRIQDNQKNNFHNQYENWFQTRHGFSSSEIFQEETDQNFIFHLSVSEIDKQNINITVDKNTLKIETEYNNQDVSEQTGLQKQMTKHNTVSSKNVKTIPLPRTVDPGGVAYKKDKDKIIIIIPKK